MSKTIKNLTLPVILEEVEQVLETYPDHPYQQAFANPDTRQELVAFVLTQVQSVYTVVDQTEETVDRSDTIPFSAEKRSCVDTIIHQGIHCVLNQSCDTIEHQIPEEEDPGLAASHWFG